MSDHWFFLSYARVDDVGPYLRKFFEDLALEVRRQANLPSGLTPDKVGFFDRRGIDVGDRWDEALLDALRSSRTFVCLYTRGYFRSEYCGKEFEVFHARQAAYEAGLAAGASRPKLILPVLWDPPSRFDTFLPDVTKDLQYSHDDFGQDYATQGLRTLLRRKSAYPDQYERVVDEMAWRLVQSGDEHRIGAGPAVASLDRTANAFAPRPGSPAAEVAAPKGPRAARFVYVAGRPDELRTVRDTVDAYDDEGGRYWRPYHPTVDKRVFALSMQVALDNELLPQELELQPSLVDELRAAEAENTVVLLIVDPWTARLATYRSRLREFDQNSFMNCAVLVPWNTSDNETVQHRDELRDQLRDVLFRAYVIGGSVPRESSTSEEEFRAEMAVAISEIRGRIMTRGTVFRTVPGAPAAALPQVQGPGGRQ